MDVDVLPLSPCVCDSVCTVRKKVINRGGRAKVSWF